MNLEIRNVVKQMIRRELTKEQEDAIERANMFHSRVNGRGVSIEHLACIMAIMCDDEFVDKLNPRPEMGLGIPEIDSREIVLNDPDKLNKLMLEWTNTPFDSEVEADCGDFGIHEGLFRGVDVAQKQLKIKFQDGVKRYIVADRVRVKKRYQGETAWNRQGELVPVENLPTAKREKVGAA